MTDPHGHLISYLRVSVTDRCNERCTYCLPEEKQAWLPRDGILSYEEILRTVRIAAGLGVRKIRVTGGEPLTRRDVLPFLQELVKVEGIEEVGLSTNGTLLAEPDSRRNGRNMAESLAALGIASVNVSLDTLDPEEYAMATGRDWLAKVLDGIEALRDAGVSSVKLNAVLSKGRTEGQMKLLLEYAAERGLLLRFIELMPVSKREVLEEDQFLSAGMAKKILELSTGPLVVDPEFRTNGPATYYQVPGTEQRIGFIGAMTNLHFCENCNKLRLTADGKLRPCLGSHLEFDLLEQIRAGADDAAVAQFFREVVARKPKDHDFRDNYMPNRHMTAIGG